MKIKISLIIISCYLTQVTAKCPSAEVMNPCRCENDYISCYGNDHYNLKNVFVSISSALKEEEKHFKYFHFSNTAINEFERNVFYDITFEKIDIMSAHNLTQINTHAFLSTNFYVKQFYLWNTPYGNITDNNNIFNALNGMINIEHIDIHNTSITSIPSNAFSVLNKLKTLFISNNRNLKSIGDNAFYELNNLTEIDLNSNPIDHISEHALNFRNRNTINLDIYFNDMPNLTSNSFSIGAFANIKRPFRLFFQNDLGIKYFYENIFGIVLSGGNRMEVFLAPLECDCKMVWLYENRAQYQKILFDAICTDGKTVFTDRQTFQSCNVY